MYPKDVGIQTIDYEFEISSYLFQEIALPVFNNCNFDKSSTFFSMHSEKRR